MTIGNAMAGTYQAERVRVEALRRVITEGLSGRGTPLLLDADPTSRYCVGVLTPPMEDADERRAQRRARRKPDALGFAARVEPEAGAIAGEVTVSFALYHRELPSFAEQRPDQNDTDREGTQRLRQKYRRTDVRLERLPFRVLPPDSGSMESVHFEAANAQIAEHLSRVRHGVGADPQCWPGESEIRAKRAELTDDTRFQQVLPKGQPLLPAWRVALVGHLLNTGDGWRLTVMIQNRSEGGTIHPVALFDSRIEVVLTAGLFTAEPLVAAAQDYRYQTLSWGRGINAVLEVAANRRSAWTETLPLYEQPRTHSTDIGQACETASLSGDSVFSALADLEATLQRYAARWEEANRTWQGDDSAKQRAADLQTFRAEVTRFQSGVEALRNDARLLWAFQLANRTVAKRGLKSWYLFQLSFIVSVLPALLAR